MIVGLVVDDVGSIVVFPVSFAFLAAELGRFDERSFPVGRPRLLLEAPDLSVGPDMVVAVAYDVE